MIKLTNNKLYYPEYQAIVFLKDTIKNEEIVSDYLNGFFSKDQENIYNLRRSFSKFVPYSVHIFPTSDCNLRCKYCFSDAGEVKFSKLSKSQIDSMLNQGAKTMLMSKKLLKDKLESFEIWLGGGGEPTYDWDLFYYTVERAKYYANKYEFDVKFGLLTNGTLQDDDKIDFICKNISYVQISLDGGPIIQNLHRPTASGEQSFAIINQFINKLVINNKHIALRSTVSDISAPKLEEITEFFCREYPSITHIHYEPLTATDRSARTQYTAPDVDTFITNLIKAMEVAKKYDKTVISSLMAFIDKRKSESFCDAMVGDTLMLQPNGYLTTCYEAMPYELDDYSIFKAGDINKDGVIRWNNERNVQQLNFANAKCKSCFCWDFCKGGCAIIKYRSEEGFKYRCEATRRLTLKMINIIASEELDKFKLHTSQILCTDHPLIEKILYWKDDVLGARSTRLSGLS